jgi:hypothetical protein
MVLFRLSLDSRASRARIKDLESKAHTSGSGRLITILHSLEKEVDNLIEETEPPIVPPLSKKHPQLKASQLKMIVSLNKALPHLKKNIAFIDPVRNSHATIVSRDVKQFEFHMIGWGILRHWSDKFEF